MGVEFVNAGAGRSSSDMNLRRSLVCCGIFALAAVAARGQKAPGQAQEVQAEPPEALPTVRDVCSRVVAGGTVPEPEDLRSRDGLLQLTLTFRSGVDAAGRKTFCYVDDDGRQEPTLRVQPGDHVVLTLKNEAMAADRGTGSQRPTGGQNGAARKPIIEDKGAAAREVCAGGGTTKTGSTNLHFHGITIPPVCHEDDVLHTAVQPGAAAFEYRFQIPGDEPPGLYWYHPHIHGSTKMQVMGGASGALIVEGIERLKPELAGLPERVLVIRDQPLLHPNAEPSPDATGKMPPVVLDADGDVKNTGTGTGKPALDLSLNFVPVPYPNYPPAVIYMKPGERQLWRVLNASAITYMSLQLLFAGQAQALGVVAVDGIPLSHHSLGGAAKVLWQKHLGIPPGGRMEFLVTGPAAGVEASLVTRSVNTGPGGENDPARPLAAIVARADAPEPRSRLQVAPAATAPADTAWLGDVPPVRTRKLYFSEVLEDPKDPNSPTTFFLTVDGETPKAFDMSSDIPNIVAHQGDVEDWIIENRSQELHAFHIHQVHFLLLEFFGLPVNEGILRDTVNVPFWDGKNAVYPRVKLRMDFRDPNVIGLFPYHCHLLEHEDSGMMGLIRVDPPVHSAAPSNK
jgi:FtsP/CotA-like multicopper oxidase with cupredoxin domain